MSQLLELLDKRVKWPNRVKTNPHTGQRTVLTWHEGDVVCADRGDYFGWDLVWTKGAQLEYSHPGNKRRRRNLLPAHRVVVRMKAGAGWKYFGHDENSVKELVIIGAIDYTCNYGSTRGLTVDYKLGSAAHEAAIRRAEGLQDD